jgi:hypothetical protein
MLSNGPKTASGVEDTGELLDSIKSAIKALTNQFKDTERLKKLYEHIGVKTFDDLRNNSKSDLLEIDEELCNMLVGEEQQEAKVYSEENLDMGF